MARLLLFESCAELAVKVDWMPLGDYRIPVAMMAGLCGAEGIHDLYISTEL
jgi:hypothetical protein